MLRSHSRRAFLAQSAGIAGGVWLTSFLPAAAQTASDPRRPLLLVHGYGEQAAFWYRPDNALVTNLFRAGYRWGPSQLAPFKYPRLALSPDVEDSQGDIASIGLALAREIQQLAARSAAGQVDLVGFSMGGLVSRWAATYLRDQVPGPALINTAVLLATPNFGADILVWLNSFGPRTQAALFDLARDLANLDLSSVAAQQMLPNSGFLQALNDAGRTDDRVRYVMIGGTMQVSLRIGPLLTTADIGDGLVSLGSALYLPAPPARSYQVSDQLSTTDEPIAAVVQRSRAFHGRLVLNDDIGLAVTNELVDSHALRDTLDLRLASGSIAL